jgi:hypothetical protein
MGANERQVGGDHYKNGGEEHWDRVHRLGLDYFQGQITKYVERWKEKNGVQDLEKALHFLEKYIELQKSVAGGVRKTVSDIVSATIQARAPELARAVTQQNALFNKLLAFARKPARSRRRPKRRARPKLR